MSEFPPTYGSAGDRGRGCGANQGPGMQCSIRRNFVPCVPPGTAPRRKADDRRIATCERRVFLARLHIAHPKSAVRQAADELALQCRQAEQDTVLPAQSPLAREGRTRPSVLAHTFTDPSQQTPKSCSPGVARRRTVAQGQQIARVCLGCDSDIAQLPYFASMPQSPNDNDSSLLHLMAVVVDSKPNNKKKEKSTFGR
jgi:hypothetical protein